ncbi:cache domain-containing protein [Marinobacterium sp. CAU 1594]|nr:cache domain-containing protein [Marinobacterium arenosum]
MSLKTKILLLAILPLILVTAVNTLISQKQAQLLSEQEIRTFEENLLASKRNELQNYVSLAMTSIAHLVAEADPHDRYAQQEIKRVLDGLTYGEDGYFFVYDRNGVNLVHPKQPELVGKNLYDMQDRNGDYVIRNLLRLASEGGGFHRYLWRKPSKHDLEDKLSYVVQIPKLNWMMGTGLYIDDIASEVAAIRNDVRRNIRNTFFTVLAIVSGAVLLVVMIGIAINVHASQLADARLRELAQKYVQFQVAQRRRFARELHDGINQLMVSVKFRIELALEKFGRQDQSAVADLDKGREVLNRAIQEVRQISHDLRPSMLDDLGLEAALQGMAEDFAERTGIQVSQRLRLPPERLPDDIEITLYRLAQEALTNVERHAEADRVRIGIWPQDGLIWLEVEDDGRGFSAPGHDGPQGIGLINMRERTELLSGSFELVSKPGQGTLVRAGFAWMADAAKHNRRRV